MSIIEGSNMNNEKGKYKKHGYKSYKSYKLYLQIVIM